MTKVLPDRIKIKELKQILDVRDNRTAKKWCRLNQIPILKDFGSRYSYVMRSDYEMGRTAQFIQSLKQRYGNQWILAYHAHVTFNLEVLIELQNRGRQFVFGSNSKIENQKGLQEQRFLTELISLTNP